MLPALLISAVVIQQPEWLLAKEHVRVRFPATAPISTGRAPACATETPNLSWLGATPRRPANFWGRGRQVMHLPCKQVDEGAIPSDSTNLLRGE